MQQVESLHKLLTLLERWPGSVGDDGNLRGLEKTLMKLCSVIGAVADLSLGSPHADFSERFLKGHVFWGEPTGHV